MNNLAKAAEGNLKSLFAQVSLRCGLSPAIVEKDFWVCWMLDYRCTWARYELATRREIRLMPPQHTLADLKDDYQHMQSMIFGPKPLFEDILSALQSLETEIHNQGKI